MASAASAVVMVRPSNLAFDPEAAGSNAFMHPPGEGRDEVRALAIAEWDGLVRLLRGRGITVHQFDDPAEPFTPDACFPNNWISCHSDGTVVLYPMLPLCRRLECRQDIIDTVSVASSRLVDLRHHAASGQFLEGTGSLVLDRVNHVAYAALSARTQRPLAESWAAELGYRLVCFRAFDARGGEIYHTNVMMSVGVGFALVCLESVRDAAEREALAAALQQSLEIIPFSLSQLDRFVGNCLHLRGADGRMTLFLSTAADEALQPDQRERIGRHGAIASTRMATIERVGGGSLRCCLLELPAMTDADAPPPALVDDPEGV